MADATSPIIGIENRTAQEVFDIMCDRIKAASPPAREEAPTEGAGERETVMAIIDANKYEAWTVDRASQMAEAILDAIASPKMGNLGSERCVMMCPQCEGEGEYADGLDDGACSTNCTRCDGIGWIVNLTALRNRTSEPEAGEAVERVGFKAGWAARTRAIDAYLMHDVTPDVDAAWHEYEPHAPATADKLRAVVAAAKDVRLAAWTDRFNRIHGHASIDALEKALAALNEGGE